MNMEKLSKGNHNTSIQNYSSEIAFGEKQIVNYKMVPIYYLCKVSKL